MLLPLSLCVLACLNPGTISTTQNPGATAPSSQASDPVEAALLLEERCLRCHGPASTDKKAIKDWPDATDLPSTLAIPDMVVPGDSEASDLFITCDEGDMPPEDEIENPLDTEELALLARWINAGGVLLRFAGPRTSDGTDDDWHSIRHTGAEVD